MCGLAGYNCQPEWAEAKLTPKKMEGVLQEAWLHNLHRGYDAAGYFLVEPDNSITTFKSPGDAVGILQKTIYGTGVPTAKVLGAHTRNPTLASPADRNENNHPVTHDGVWVTHNGTISNHESIKKTLATAADKIPGVDSVAIAMLLSEVNNPFDLQEALPLLGELQGGFAFHAIWEQSPGLSLLARGTTQPLIIAYREDIGTFYGSEPESIWHMLYEIGGKKLANDKSWLWRDFHTNVAMLMFDGTPMEWGTIQTKTNYHSSSNVLDYNNVRVLPRETGRKAKDVYRTDLTYDFPHRTIPSIADNIALGKLIYTRKTGAVRNTDGFPRTSGDSDIFGIGSEADSIYEHNSFYHLFYGDIEVVMTNGRVVKDVFNHALFPNSKRWRKEKKAKKLSAVSTAPESFESWESFITRKGTHVKPQDIPQAPEKYEYVIRQEEIKNKLPKALPSKSHHSGANSTDTKVTTVVISEEVDTDGLSRVTANVDLSWGTIDTKTISHAEPWFIFLSNSVCPVHNQDFINHTNPADCFIIRNATTFTYSAFDGVDLYGYVSDSAEVDWVFTETYCDLTSSETERCWWRPIVVGEIHSKKSYWEIPLQDACYLCGTSRTLTKYPKWFDKLEAFIVKGVAHAT